MICSHNIKKLSCGPSSDQKPVIIASLYRKDFISHLKIYEQRTCNKSKRARWTVPHQHHVQGHLRLTDSSGNIYTIQLAKKLNIAIRDLIVTREDHKPINIGEGTKLGDIPYFVDGAILHVASKNPKKEALHTGIKASDIE